MTSARMNLRIDCDTCVARRTDACTDCLVTFLCADDGERHTGAVVLELAEWRALRSLQEAGLAPRLRHRSEAVERARGGVVGAG